MPPASSHPHGTAPGATTGGTGHVGPVELLGIDHVEFWVGNATQAAHFLTSVMGFRRIATAGPETGVSTHVSHVLAQGAIRFVVTGGLDPDGAVAVHVRTHGDGVRRVAFAVADADVAHARAVAAGATPTGDVQQGPDDSGVSQASIEAWGDAEYTFVSRHGSPGAWSAGFMRIEASPDVDVPDVGLTRIDHVVANTATGTLGSWVEWHTRVLGLRPRAEFSADVSTARSALSSTVLSNDAGTVTMPINEPAAGPHRSQIQEFLDSWGGPGIQHLALATDDIVTAVAAMRRRGLDFLTAGEDYHDQARERVGQVDIAWDDVRRLGIMVDRDAQGHLLQIFTAPVQDRPTLFYEIIQRMGSTGFGAGNFGALFASIEQAQERRGNL